MTIYEYVAKWPAAWREEFEERVAIVMEGCGCSEEEAMQQAFEIVKKRIEERTGSDG